MTRLYNEQSHLFALANTQRSHLCSPASTKTAKLMLQVIKLQENLIVTTGPVIS